MSVAWLYHGHWEIRSTSLFSTVASTRTLDLLAVTHRGMSEKRRAEIEAKRAKLAELRKARADRQRAETERRQTEVCLKLTSNTESQALDICRLQAHPLQHAAMSTS